MLKILIFVLNIIIIFSLVLLLISSKFSIIFILILSTISLLIIFISRKYIYSLGKQFLNFSELWMLKLKDSSKAIKQIKLMNLENYFLNDFVKNNKEFNFTNALKNTITLAPRFIIEIFVILILCTLIYISSTNETINQNDLLINLAFMGVVISRIIPLLNNTLTIWTNLSFLKPITEDIISSSELNSDKLKSKDNTIHNNEKKLFNNLVFKDLSFKYPEGNDYIFKDLNLEISLNKVIGITGPSGSGKSTFLDLICNLLIPTKGEIKIDDNDLVNLDRIWLNSIGYASQEVVTIDSSIYSNILFGREKEIKLDENRIKKLLKNVSQICCLEDFINSLPNKYLTKVGEDGSLLSGGQKQRISLARAIVFEPSILILDEVTSALDQKTEDDIINNIIKSKIFKTIFISTHNKKNLEYCDQIIEIKDNSIKFINK